MDEAGGIETVELDDERFIALESTRNWPKYVIEWSVRRRSGDSDYPLAHGEVESMPPTEGETLEEMWARLREDALAQATAASGAEQTQEPKRSFLGRLFGRD